MVKLHWTVRLCHRWHCWRGRHIAHEQVVEIGDHLHLIRSCIRRQSCSWTDRRRLPDRFP